MSPRPPPRAPSRPPRQVRRGPVAPPPRAGSAGGIGVGGISGLTMKRMIWTGAFAAVAIAGAIYGAGLKTQQEYKAEKKQIIETSVENRVRDLEERRAGLVAQRLPIERKLGELRTRIRESELKLSSNSKDSAEGDR
ncbi:hypothetical protein F5X99DRAFT_103262 [Biscogniauxia marginata]|nr:hypothetical protein F5X99DRAFT_103262 [Biscogniauxia marginata]